MPEWTRPGHALRRRGLHPALYLAAVCLCLAALWLAARFDPLPPPIMGPATAIDGDTLRLAGERIRLLGIDAPERDQRCWDASGTEWPCGNVARQALAELMRPAPITCAPWGRDKYSRTLARCEAAGRDLAATLVAAGLALARDDYGTEQAAARAAHLGLWQGRFIDPRIWRREGPAADPGPGWPERLWSWFRQLTGARTLR